MKRFLTPILMAAALALPTTAAQAHDWSGAYVGGYGAYLTTASTWGVGAKAGYVFDVGGGFFAGPEVDAIYAPSGSAWFASGSAKLGYALSPDLLAFAKLGAGVTNGPAYRWLVGGGLDYAVSDSVVLEVGAERLATFGGGTTTWILKAGVNYEF